MSPSFEDFTGWGAHWVLTQGVFSGVRYSTLKRLISQRGLAKIREQHGSLPDWYVHASKIEGPNFETFSKLLKLEGPQVLDNSLEELKVLVSNCFWAKVVPSQKAYIERCQHVH